MQLVTRSVLKLFSSFYNGRKSHRDASVPEGHVFLQCHNSCNVDSTTKHQVLRKASSGQTR
eukprot:6489890-Amphidinium_carterae.1